MSAVAGATAGGVLLNWLTADYAERARRTVLDAAESEGRPRPLVMAYVRCGIAPAAHTRLQAELSHYDAVPHFQRHLERMGVDAPQTCVVASDADDLQAGIRRYEAVLDETIVRALTPDDRLDGLVALADACAP
jgi:alkanesulfonate monooxygenase SsuD/methylene tetrahydromethanopterin reductase-like flavin-dependent oxidoreductase (luciferase family)